MICDSIDLLLLERSNFEGILECLKTFSLILIRITTCHDPIDLQTKELKETNSMVEEFMLLANVTVASHIQKEFPECAVLRRHPEPPQANFDPLTLAAKTRNINIDVSKKRHFRHAD